ncbi:hypothetical protein ACE2AK_01235 [Rahnella perminowiae]|uniref:hypothetical protein n=1 Tax=Rahnella perminowiae TaxID=2816244 RepID=UPI00366373D2
MYKIICDFRSIYIKFLSQNQVEGVCFGLSLTWLGDMLKSRNMRGSGFTVYNRYPKESIFPGAKDVTLLIDTFHRARLKQIHMEGRTENYNQRSANEVSCALFTAKYKDRKQRSLEAKYKVPGLRYTYSNITRHKEIKALDWNSTSIPLKQGVIIIFTLGPRVADSHAVAAIRFNQNETYFLEPNYGLFLITGDNPTEVIDKIVFQKYGYFKFKEQIVITA